MRNSLMGLVMLAMAYPTCALAQESEPLLIVPQVVEQTPYLPANTEVVVALNQELTTKGKAFNEGDTFGLTVQYPVFLDDVVVIPKGARATGRITWLTSKGAFGKSGKMEIEIEYVEVNGRRIPLEGQFRQEGEGNTVATVGGVVAVGVLAGFITGKSAVIPRGRELTVHTREDLPVRIARPAPPQPAAPQGQVASAAPRTPAKQPAQSFGLVPVGQR